MLSKYAAAPLTLLFLLTTNVAASERLPAIKLTKQNAPPACATPGRLMALLKQRNPELDPRFAQIANLYRAHGNEVGVRWDHAFFQMILETGALKFRRGDGSPSDVRASQHNFAGLGATGNGERGETFPDVSTGVKAHLQHLAHYAGDHIDAPVADRTRKVQSWGIVKRWHKKLRKPITFANIASVWAPGSRGYSRDMASIAKGFYDTQCQQPDPAPELDMVAGQITIPPRASTATRLAGPEPRRDKLPEKNALGARDAAPPPAREAVKERTPAITIVNPVQEEQPPPPAAQATTPNALDSVALPPRKPAKLAAALKPQAKSAARATAVAQRKCRVWTASYGGQKAVLIRAETEEFTNYTVLDVNTGKEQREAAAYIAAYAKGGQKVEEFATQTQALTKAFELCPDG